MLNSLKCTAIEILQASVERLKHSVSPDTYPAPAHGWTCFHCGETFHTPHSARMHFGITIYEDPGCVIARLTRKENALLYELRKEQETVRKMLVDYDDKQNAYYAMAAEHARALRKAEETGYMRGMNDARREVQGLLT